MIQIIKNPDVALWPSLCRRATFDDAAIDSRVRDILARVKEEGDKALRALAEEIDGFCPESFLVSEEELANAASCVPQSLQEAIKTAKRNIEVFHQKELPSSFTAETMPGVVCQRRMLPIRRVGLYIPGGSAPLFSTILMLAIPAKIAGCPEVILCTPCDKKGNVNPVILWTAQLCGVSTIYKLGGAGAVAAMAYGTETMKPVCKIFGPGNRYVTKAKQYVSTEGVAIDMPAGPSEIMVLADDTANPLFIAADMLSQAEHGPDSQALVVCHSEETAQRINEELDAQIKLLPRATIATKALQNSRIVVFDTNDTSERDSLYLRFADSYAPEHLIIEMKDPWAIASKVTAAGSVFVGHFSPESAGDYASGTNHTLPTMGLAKSFSGVGVDSFLHAISYQELTSDGLELLSQTIISMAEAEGLTAHANAVKVRVGQK
ncbi:MAG: histidinol dehydrogenase [Bacteroidaceae bacterium]|nr:histidinol dehydrogenase [Bacteroidaceae bacterium]